ncbi:hypothetical protein NXV95_07635 [Bacteroides fragilis]|nr:hypothetical protein [Bacteroides fragilis]
MEKGFLLVLFLILGLNLASSYCYVLLILVLISVTIYIFVSHSKIRYKKGIDFIPLSFFLIWIYGLLIGYYNGNKGTYIVANFAGMFCYLLYYVFIILDISVIKLVNVLKFATISTSIIAIIYYVSDALGVDIAFLNNILGDVNQGSSTGQLRAYFTDLNVGFTLWVVSFVYLLIEKKEKDLLITRNKFKILYIIFPMDNLYFIFCYGFKRIYVSWGFLCFFDPNNIVCKKDVIR